MEILKTFETVYTKKTKHRKKCLVCGKLINDGEKVVMELRQETKYYPVKGIMKFNSWKFRHLGCN